MRRAALLPPLAAVLFLSVGVVCADAQETTQRVQQQSAGIQLFPYTAEQRWARNANMLDVSFAVLLAHGKKSGQTPDDIAQFLAETFKEGWGAPNSGEAVRVFRGMYRNWMMWPGSSVDVIAATDTSVTARTSRPYVASFGTTKSLYGVTLDEYEQMMRSFNRRIAEHLGLRYTDRVESDNLVFTVSGRGSAAPGAFVPGTYAVTFTATDAGVMPDIIGTWEITYAPDGRFSVAHDGKRKYEGEYVTRLDQITFSKEQGVDGCANAGTYRWTPSTNGTLFFGRLVDACEGRQRVLTAKALTKK